SLFKRQVRRFEVDQPILGHRAELSVTAKAATRKADHFIAWHEPGDLGADGFDHAGEFGTENWLPRSGESKYEPPQETETCWHFEAPCAPVSGVDRRGMN